MTYVYTCFIFITPIESRQYTVEFTSFVSCAVFCMPTCEPAKFSHDDDDDVRTTMTVQPS